LPVLSIVGAWLPLRVLALSHRLCKSWTAALMPSAEGRRLVAFNGVADQPWLTPLMRWFNRVTLNYCVGDALLLSLRALSDYAPWVEGVGITFPAHVRQLALPACVCNITLTYDGAHTAQAQAAVMDRLAQLAPRLDTLKIYKAADAAPFDTSVLRRWPHLVKFHIGGFIQDARPLRDLPSLTTVFFTIPYTGLAPLLDLPASQWRELYLTCTEGALTHEDVTRLVRAHPRVTDLHLSVLGTNGAELRDLRGLRDLSVAATHVDDAFLRNIVALPQLTCLGLETMHPEPLASSALAACLKQLSHLTVLRLTDVHLADLTFLQSVATTLSELDLDKTNIPLHADRLRELACCRRLHTLTVKSAFTPAVTAAHMALFGVNAFFPHLHTLRY
jgi:hypothetical protein